MGTWRNRKRRLRQESTSPQSLSGAGAIDITTPLTLFTSTGSAQALTIASHTVVGFRKTIVHKVDGGSGVLTGTFDPALTSITLTTVRASVDLEWTGTGWAVVGWSGAVTTDITFT